MSSWTVRVREGVSGAVPEGQWLPDRQPIYVASWVYLFGIVTLAGLAVAFLSGTVLALGGATWWHTSSVGHFFNSLHLWSVEVFFAALAVHLWGQFWMASWR